MQIAEAFVAIRPNPDSKATFQREVTGIVTPGATKAGQDAGKALGAGMTSSVKSAVLGLGALVGSIGAGVALKSAFGAATDATRANAQLAAVLKSTGAVAGVTTADVEKLAQSQLKLGIADDETTKRGAALLLTFKQVRNEAGANNNVFDRTLKVSADLAAALGGDLQSSVIQLGKALEDPTTGLTALRRVGVSFTAQERDQIKTMVEHNNLLGAQKTILASVESQFGGTAAALAKADPFQRFGISLNEFKESVGKDLLPIASDVLAVGEELFAVFEKLPGPVRSTAEAIVAVGIAGAGLASFASLTGLSSILGTVKTALFGVATGETAATVAAEANTAANVELAASETAVGAAAVSTGAIIGGLILGLGAGALAGSKLNEVLAGSQPNIDAYAKSLDNLGKSGGLSGVALDVVGEHALKLSGDLKTIQGSTLEKAFGLAPSAHRAVADIKSVNDALISLANTQGKDAANLAFGKLVNDLLANGTKIGDIGVQFEPFFDALDKIPAKAGAAGAAVQSAADQINNLLGAGSKAQDLAGRLGVLDQFDAVSSAVDDLNQAKLDAAGVGEKSKAAADAETTALDNQKQAYESLADAQRSALDSSRSLADAQNNLADAQAKLAEFDNPTSSTIRSLERENIVRRVVSTPEEVRQKEIDLLKNDQSNTDTRASLVKGVASAQEGLAKALEAVQTAERNVQKAAEKVGDAQRAVAEAAQKRRSVQEDALKSIEGLERKAQEAALSAGAAFAQWAEDAQPADDVLKNMLGKLELIVAAAGDKGLALNLQNIVNQINAANQGAGQLGGNLQHGGFGHGRPAQASTTGLDQGAVGDVAAGRAPVTSAQLNAVLAAGPDFTISQLNEIFGGAITHEQEDYLHKLGVPGFKVGGVAQWPMGEARLALIHGQERIQTPDEQRAADTPAAPQPAQPTPPAPKHIEVAQHIAFHASEHTAADLEWSNRQLAFLMTRLGDEA